MPEYQFEPDDLSAIAKQAVDLEGDAGERVARVTALLAARYPQLIPTESGRWVGNKAGGILGKVRFLYFTPREYVVIFGSPSGTQGFSGRYKRVEIHKWLLAGRIDSYDLESDQTTMDTLMPGEHGWLAKGQVKGLTIHPGSFHLEYGRGAIVTTLPFATADTLLSSLETSSMGRSAVEFTRMVRRRPRR